MPSPEELFKKISAFASMAKVTLDITVEQVAATQHVIKEITRSLSSIANCLVDPPVPDIIDFTSEDQTTNAMYAISDKNPELFTDSFVKLAALQKTDETRYDAIISSIHQLVN